MKVAFVFAKLVTFFLMFQQITYTGKLPIKIYVHMVYWVIMIPVLVCEGLQIKYGNTVKKTKIICAGLLIRLLLSNFDFEGRLLKLNYDYRVMSLNINFIAGIILTMFFCMFVEKYIFVVMISLAVAFLQTTAWEYGIYESKLISDQGFEDYKKNCILQKDLTRVKIGSIVV